MTTNELCKNAAIGDLGLIKAKLALLNTNSNIRCFLLYGSAAKAENQARVGDTDLIIVVSDIKLNMDNLFDLIFDNFFNPDFHIYTVKEIENNISYFSREYVLEYLAKGKCLIGENIFRQKFMEITDRQYRESLFIRTVEHIQMVRKVYFSKNHSLSHKLSYLKKYLLRIAKNILLFGGIANYDALDKASSIEIFGLLKSHHLIAKDINAEAFVLDRLELCYKIFCEVSNTLLKCREELMSVNKRPNEMRICL